MKSLVSRAGLSTVAVLSVAVALGFAFHANAQEKGKAKRPGIQKKEVDPKPAAKEPQDKDEPAGRLPPYYKDVVDEAQRDKIYAIQAEYADRIDRLRKQLDDLLEQRDQRIEAVLTPQQRAKVEAAREDAKAKKAGKKAKEKLKLPGRKAAAA
jgi:hypothetical protein